MKIDLLKALKWSAILMLCLQCFPARESIIAKFLPVLT